MPHQQLLPPLRVSIDRDSQYYASIANLSDPELGLEYTYYQAIWNTHNAPYCDYLNALSKMALIVMEAGDRLFDLRF